MTINGRHKLTKVGDTAGEVVMVRSMLKLVAGERDRLRVEVKRLTAQLAGAQLSTRRPDAAWWSSLLEGEATDRRISGTVDRRREVRDLVEHDRRRGPDCTTTCAHAQAGPS